MRIKGSLARGLLIALAIALIPIAAVSAQKINPGSTCKVLKQKVIYLKKTYTCTKSGNKLVWNMGVAIKSTPTPTPTPTGKTVYASAGINAALESFAQFPKSKVAPQEITFIFGPNADKETSGLIEDNARATMALFVDFYQDSKPYPIFYGSNEDLEWVIAQWAKFGYTEATIGNEFQYAVKNLRDRSVPPNFFVGSENRFPQTPMILLGSKAAISRLTSPYRQIVVIHHVIHGIQGRITGYKD
jgi:hypothetical protein